MTKLTDFNFISFPLATEESKANMFLSTEYFKVWNNKWREEKWRRDLPERPWQSATLAGGVCPTVNFCVMATLRCRQILLSNQLSLLLTVHHVDWPVMPQLLTRSRISGNSQLWALPLAPRRKRKGFGDPLSV